MSRSERDEKFIRLLHALEEAERDCLCREAAQVECAKALSNAEQQLKVSERCANQARVDFVNYLRAEFPNLSVIYGDTLYAADAIGDCQINGGLRVSPWNGVVIPLEEQ